MLDVIQRQSLQEESIHKNIRIRAVANKKALSEIIRAVKDSREKKTNRSPSDDIRHQIEPRRDHVPTKRTTEHTGTTYPQRGPLNTQGPRTHREDH